MEPEQNPNAANAQGENYCLSWIEEQTVLQRFEMLNTPRKTFKPLTLWQSDETTFGAPRSAKRTAFTTYWSNHMRRVSITTYAKTLKAHEVKMGTATKAEFEAARKNDGVQKEVKFLSQTDIVPPVPPVFRDANNDELTSISHRVKEISFDNGNGKQTQFRQPEFGFGTPPRVHHGNGSVMSSPNASFDAGYGGSPAGAQPAFHLVSDYIPDGTVEQPTPIYFHADGNAHKHGIVFIAPGIKKMGSEQHNIVDFEITVAPDDSDLYSMRLARYEELPDCFKKYFGRAIFLCVPAMDFYTKKVEKYEAKWTDKDSTVQARSAAKTDLEENPSLAENIYLLLFPFTMEPFDNSVFSSHPQKIEVNRTTPIKCLAAESAFNVVTYATTLTWVVALSGKSRTLAAKKSVIDNKASYFS